MLNKNEFEKSVITLKNNVPVFVRDSYTKFTSVFKTTNDLIKLLSEQNPSTADKFAKMILSQEISLFGALRSVIGEDRSKKILLEIRDGLNINVADKINADERFSYVTGADIYAPVTDICACLTPFGKERQATAKVIPVVFEVYGCKSRYDGPEIDGLNGQSTVLDDLSACCGIDINAVFDRFMTHAIENWRSKNQDVEFSVNTLADVYGSIDDNLAEESVSILIPDLLATTISTYFAFAAKLLGSKQDIFQWAYTAFVKDSMNHYDKTHYVTGANITKASGHAVDGRGYGNKASDYDEASTDIIMDTTSAGGTNTAEKAYKAMLYRNIRLQYSSWAATINAIFSRAITRKADGQFSSEWLKNAGKGLMLDHFACRPSEYDHLCRFIGEAIVQYAAAKYRTYNTTIQLDDNLKPIETERLISKSVSRVKDEASVQIIKAAIRSYNTSDIYIPYNPKTAGVLALDNNVKNAVADTFMDAAYLLILNYVHATMSKVMEEIDTTTGKTNKVLFDEIYSGVKHKIYMDIEKYSSASYDNGRINTAISTYTPYVVDKTVIEAKNDKNDFIKSVAEFLGENTLDRLTGYDKNDLTIKYFNPYIEVICAPLVSEYNKLKNVYDFDGDILVAGAPVDGSNGRGNSTFPKNRLIVEGLSKFGSELATNKAFSSLESADAAVKDLADKVEEGADAMASNSMYSALGSIGGGIIEIETANDYEKNELSDKTAPITDNNGMAIKQGTSDTEDLANIVSKAIESYVPDASEESHKVTEAYNRLFNKVILGIE